MENEHGIANIVVVNNVVQNPMTSTPTPGKIQTLKIKVRLYVIFFTKTLIHILTILDIFDSFFVLKNNKEVTSKTQILHRN